MCTQLKSCELSCIQGLTEDQSQDSPSEMALRDCSEEAGERLVGASILILAKEHVQSNIHLGRSSLPATRNRYPS